MKPAAGAFALGDSSRRLGTAVTMGSMNGVAGGGGVYRTNLRKGEGLSYARTTGALMTVLGAALGSATARLGILSSTPRNFADDYFLTGLNEGIQESGQGVLQSALTKEKLLEGRSYDFQLGAVAGILIKGSMQSMGYIGRKGLQPEVNFDQELFTELVAVLRTVRDEPDVSKLVSRVMSSEKLRALPGVKQMQQLTETSKEVETLEFPVVGVDQAGDTNKPAANDDFGNLPPESLPKVVGEEFVIVQPEQLPGSNKAEGQSAEVIDFSPRMSAGDDKGPDRPDAVRTNVSASASEARGEPGERNSSPGAQVLPEVAKTIKDLTSRLRFEGHQRAASIIEYNFERKLSELSEGGKGVNQKQKSVEHWATKLVKEGIASVNQATDGAPRELVESSIAKIAMLSGSEKKATDVQRNINTVVKMSVSVRERLAEFRQLTPTEHGLELPLEKLYQTRALLEIESVGNSKVELNKFQKLDSRAKALTSALASLSELTGSMNIEQLTSSGLEGIYRKLTELVNSDSTIAKKQIGKLVEMIEEVAPVLDEVTGTNFKSENYREVVHLLMANRIREAVESVGVGGTATRLAPFKVWLKTVEQTVSALKKLEPSKPNSPASQTFKKAFEEIHEILDSGGEPKKLAELVDGKLARLKQDLAKAAPISKLVGGSKAKNPLLEAREEARLNSSGDAFQKELDATVAGLEAMGLKDIGTLLKNKVLALKETERNTRNRAASDIWLNHFSDLNLKLAAVGPDNLRHVQPEEAFNRLYDVLSNSTPIKEAASKVKSLMGRVDSVVEGTLQVDSVSPNIATRDALLALTGEKVIAAYDTSGIHSGRHYSDWSTAVVELLEDYKKRFDGSKNEERIRFNGDFIEEAILQLASEIKPGFDKEGRAATLSSFIESSGLALKNYREIETKNVELAEMFSDTLLRQREVLVTTDNLRTSPHYRDFQEKLASSMLRIAIGTEMQQLSQENGAEQIVQSVKTILDPQTRNSLMKLEGLAVRLDDALKVRTELMKLPNDQTGTDQLVEDYNLKLERAFTAAVNRTFGHRELRSWGTNVLAPYSRMQRDLLNTDYSPDQISQIQGFQKRLLDLSANYSRADKLDLESSKIMEEYRSLFPESREIDLTMPDIEKDTEAVAQFIVDTFGSSELTLKKIAGSTNQKFENEVTERFQRAGLIGISTLFAHYPPNSSFVSVLEEIETGMPLNSRFKKIVSLVDFSLLQSDADYGRAVRAMDELHQLMGDSSVELDSTHDLIFNSWGFESDQGHLIRQVIQLLQQQL